MKRISFILIVTLLSMGQELSAQRNLDFKLFGYFPFNGNTVDSSQSLTNGSGANLTLTAGVDGALRSAYSFNGSSSGLNCGVSNRNVTDSVTISAWIKTEATSAGYIVSKYDYDWVVDRGYALYYDMGSVGIAGRNMSGNFINTINSSIKVNDNSWHHIIGVVHGNTWKVWIDCKLATTTTSFATAPSLINNQPLVIGYNNYMGSPTSYFLGEIDEVRIYNRGLASIELDSLCQLPTVSGTESHSNLNSKLTIFPNPSADYISISAPDAKQREVNIYALDAKLIYSTKIYSSLSKINTSKLSSGFYLLKVVENGVLVHQEKISKI